MAEKKVKDGKILTQKEKNKIALDKAKKKINDPNYNVASGEIQKDKNVQTNVKKNIKEAKIRKKKRLDASSTVQNIGRPNENRRVLKKRNIVDDVGTALSMSPFGFLRKQGLKLAQKVPGVQSTLKKIGDKVVRGARSTSNRIQQRNVKGQGSGKILPPKVNPRASRVTTTRTTGGGQGSGRFITQRKSRPTNTQITKPRNTQLKKPNTSLVTRQTRRYSPNRGPQQLANRAVVSTGLSELIKPKKSIAEPNKIVKPKKEDFTPNIKKPTIPEVKKEKIKKTGPAKDYTGKFVNEKGEVAYDSIGDFFKNITGTAKKRARPENRKRIQAETRGATKGIGFSGRSVGNPFKFNKGGKTVKRAAGGLKPVPEGNKGLGKLPQPVRNKMGFMRGGGKVVKMRGGGAATRGMNFNRGY